MTRFGLSEFGKFTATKIRVSIFVLQILILLLLLLPSSPFSSLTTAQAQTPISNYFHNLPASTPSRHPSTPVPMNTNDVLNIPIWDYFGIPSSATAVLANITVIANSSGGYLTAFPAYTTRPNAATVNWYNGGASIVGNFAIVPLDSNGQFTIYNGGASKGIVIDVVGYNLQVPCNSTNPYIPNTPGWSLNFVGSFYWDGSTPASLNTTILDGMATWNNAPYRNPVFLVTSNASSAQGVIRFLSIDFCGNTPDPAACATVDPVNRNWTITYNTKRRSDNSYLYCFISNAEGAIPGCIDAGHISNHEYGHVMTLDHNYSYTNGVAESIVGDVRDSTDRVIGVVRERGCGDNNALNNRYGRI